MTTPRLDLPEVDRIEITTLYDCMVDATAPSVGPAKRLQAKDDQPIVSDLLEGEQRRGFVGGHGLSMLVTVTQGERTRSLLFDAGGDPNALVNNLERLELDPRMFSAIALSHGHWDHTVGLVGLQRKMGRMNLPLVLHPDAYRRRATLNEDGELNPPMASLSRQGLRDAGLEVAESVEPAYLLEKMLLVTGQVARTNDYEIGWPAHHALIDGAWQPDPLICDDQGLAINLRGKGLVVLSGCGHAGIVNTVHYAQAITGVERVHAVLGGFHLGPNFFADRIGKVVGALVALEPALIVPAHCTGIRASLAVAQAIPAAFVNNTVGTRYTLEGATDSNVVDESEGAEAQLELARRRIQELGTGELELRG
jgi:7,8-dihydropterin-6-yl-methyl-4-(beta-D-ribofuranosyl)aminobenzene 5'-phosphate synthase